MVLSSVWKNISGMSVSLVLNPLREPKGKHPDQETIKWILADLFRKVSSTQVVSNFHWTASRSWISSFLSQEGICSLRSPIHTSLPPNCLTCINRPHLNISPWNGQDATGAPWGCADGAQSLSIFTWFYRNDGMIRQKRSEMLLPVYFFKYKFRRC